MIEHKRIEFLKYLDDLLKSIPSEDNWQQWHTIRAIKEKYLETEFDLFRLDKIPTEIKQYI